MHDRLLAAVDARTDDLVALTADLIRFPTINPPGEAYRPCAEYVGERLRGLSQVELSDLAVYVTAIAAGCADRAAERSTPSDDARLEAWLAAADFTEPAEARRSAGGFLLELAVLSQSTRLVREQIRLQAEFGPLLWLGMRDAELRASTAASARTIAAAVAGSRGEAARAEITAQLGRVAHWLLSAKARIETGGSIDG